MSKLSIATATSSKKLPLYDIAAGTIVLDEDNAPLIVTDCDNVHGVDDKYIGVVSLGSGIFFEVPATQEFRVSLTADLKVTY
ncbi:hypothetical protein FDJ20_gp107 [Vibrio phage Thalassa]|uniref:Uncharacterized protein n=1 Tax=Vibrio phage Thalassa TaxID=2570301 RepID=A0A2H5BHC0_9CAUD|nr:hypothetical protein FDJ20_gp004 [Vibrio phage Thalassa]YP_009621476.1 hypothetical protein FDJ20_gp107 [Vibrio phage Thalassa]AUG85206.1 hypothetical protein THALASSA_4 [Vibrio phage Thalassa]AUG85395.1 hypothetical protein THALASSA_216 [Vibrio phage Thalassa]